MLRYEDLMFFFKMAAVCHVEFVGHILGHPPADCMVVSVVVQNLVEVLEKGPLNGCV